MISTHVLDLAGGAPAAGVPVELHLREASGWSKLAESQTDADGRVRELMPKGAAPRAGTYRIRFDTSSRSPFFPEVSIVFEVRDPAGHYHLPLLLAPHGYSTYRGS